MNDKEEEVPGMGLKILGKCSLRETWFGKDASGGTLNQCIVENATSKDKEMADSEDDMPGQKFE